MSLYSGSAPGSSAGTPVVVVVVGGGWAVVRGGLLGRSAPAAAARVPTGTVAGTRTDVVERQQVAGTLGYGDSVTVVGQTWGGDAGGPSGVGGGGQARGPDLWA